jgi:hypothetical protein
MFTKFTSAGALVGSAVGNTMVTANVAAKAALLASACFVRGFKAGWLRATSVTPQERRTAEAQLPAGWIKEVA